MIGPRIGLRAGIKAGLAVGVSADKLGGAMDGVARDAASGIYCPATAAQWNTALRAAGIATGGPSLLWLCQEASGNLADSIGSFTGTASGTGITYQQTVAGWTRKGVALTDAGTGKFTNASGSLPSLASASQLSVVYGTWTAAAAERNIISEGLATHLSADIGASPTFHPAVQHGGASTVGTSDMHNRVLPYVIKHNFTASAQAVYTDNEKVVPTFAALAGQTLILGANGNASPTGTALYVASFFGSAAELTDAQVKKLLQTLGWTINWS